MSVLGGGTPPRPRSVWSIRWIATALAVLLTAAGVLAVGAVSEHHARAALRHEIEARLELSARNLAASSASALLGDFPELTLHPLVRAIRAQQPELELAVVVDHRGTIQGHDEARALGTTFEPPAGLRLGGAVITRDFLQTAGSRMVAGTPVRNAAGDVIGAAYVGLPLRYIENAVTSARRQQALLLGALVALGAAAAFLLMSQLLRPVAALRAGLERIGRGDLETPIRVHDRTELGLLADTVNDMASALKSAQHEMLERERLAHEVDLAREIQRSLLPAERITAGAFEIRGDQRAAAEVGGDYWDVLQLPGGRTGIAIADVAGKGLAGCLVMSMLSALLRALRTTHDSPSAMLAALDDHLSETLQPGVFVTMCYAVLDPPTGRLTFASAGHTPPLVWRDATGETRALPSRGIPIGAVRGGAIRSTLRDETITLAPGDVCVLFTDGYTEAFRDGGEELFGTERIEATVTETAPRGAGPVLTALRDALRAWSGEGTPSDDETLVVLCHQGSAAGRPPLKLFERLGADEAESAVTQLVRAERSGAGIRLAARLDSLVALDSWLRGIAELASLPPARFEVVRAAVYEAVANIVEHGCDENGDHGIGVWWIAERRAERAAEELGAFVLLDEGRPFRPANPPATNFEDPAVRTRGRGIGREIMHRALSRIAYYPATPRGNITLLTVGEMDSALTEESSA